MPPSLLQEARSINATLSRVQQVLSWTVHQSQAVSEILHQDQSVVQGALSDHKVELRNALHATRKRLDKLQFAENVEKLGMKIATYVFMGAVIFIVLSRLRLFQLLVGFLSCQFTPSSKDEL